MTNDFEFIKYEPTPLQKYLGIATVRVFGKIVLRYKIVPTAKGCGFFPAPASYKTSDDSYTHAFLLDSRSDEEELFHLIRSNVKPQIEQKTLSEEETPF
jgi:hypothetical protein